MAGSCALLAGAVCLQSETSGGSGEAPALRFHGSFYISPGCTENDTVGDPAFFAKQKKYTDVGEEHNWEQDDLMLSVP